MSSEVARKYYGSSRSLLLSLAVLIALPVFAGTIRIHEAEAVLC
jgi:hypothetical protein